MCGYAPPSSPSPDRALAEADTCLVQALAELQVQLPRFGPGPFWALRDGNEMLRSAGMHLAAVTGSFASAGRYVVWADGHFRAVVVGPSGCTTPAAEKWFRLTEGLVSQEDCLCDLADRDVLGGTSVFDDPDGIPFSVAALAQRVGRLVRYGTAGAGEWIASSGLAMETANVRLTTWADLHNDKRATTEARCDDEAEAMEMMRGVAMAEDPPVQRIEDDEPVAEDPLAADAILCQDDMMDAEASEVIEKAKRRRLMPGAAQSAEVFRSMLGGYRRAWLDRASVDIVPISADADLGPW